MTKLVSTNPGKNYEVVGEVEVSTRAGVEMAFQKAKAAFLSWKNIGTSGRKEYLQKFHNILQNHVEEMAMLQTKEMGKPIVESRNDIVGTLDWLKWNIDNCERVLQDKLVNETDNEKVFMRHEPYGPIVAISPWNFPLNTMFISVIQALLAGNTILFKHSEECALMSKFVDEKFKEVGLPEGVFNTLYGNGEVGKMMLEQEVKLVHFTGSTKAGQAIYKMAGEKFIPAVMEMGGSSPGIMFEDADVSKFARQVYFERFWNNGQVCNALKRMFVHEKVFDQFVEELRKVINEQVVGDPEKETTTLGPLVAKRQLDLLLSQVQDAKDKGASVEYLGQMESGLSGAYHQPVIITNVTKDMRVVTEEVFGPVLPIIKFSNDEEVLQMANDTDYGLSAYFYTENQERIQKFISNLESGHVSVNGTNFFSPKVPFGGYKKSGIGRADGEYGYLGVTQIKVFSVENQ